MQHFRSYSNTCTDLSDERERFEPTDIFYGSKSRRSESELRRSESKPFRTYEKSEINSTYDATSQMSIEHQTSRPNGARVTGLFRSMAFSEEKRPNRACTLIEGTSVLAVCGLYRVFSTDSGLETTLDHPFE